MTSILTPFREWDLATRPRLAPVATTAAVPFDAVRTASALQLSFDLPGYAPADVELSVDRNVLTLSAERSRPVAEDATVLVGERRHGRVRRQLRLSDSLDLSSIEARFDNGVLTVTVPVAETAQPHKVEIAVGANPVVEAAVVDGDDDGAGSASSN
jgi:HSP20 family protein